MLITNPSIRTPLPVLPRTAGAPLEQQPAVALPSDSLSLAGQPDAGQAAPSAASTQNTTRADEPSRSNNFGQLLEDLRDAKIVGYGKVSRGMPEPGLVKLPRKPQCFPAISKELIFQSPQGVRQKILVDAEGSLGHFTPIDPGETIIPGARLVWQREGKPQELTPEEGGKVLSQLYSNFARRLPEVQLQRLQEAVDMVAAVVHNGKGWEAVETSHRQGVANAMALRTLFPDDYPGS